MDSKNFLQGQIETQKGNMRISLAFSLALLLLGILLTAWFLRAAGPAISSYPDLMKIGPLLITSTVAALPLKAFLSYRTENTLLRSAKLRPLDYPATGCGTPRSTDQLRRLRSRIFLWHRLTRYCRRWLGDRDW